MEKGRFSNFVSGGHRMRDVFIVEAVRSPIGKRDGELSHIRPDELAAEVLKELMNRISLSAGIVEDVIMGCVSQVGEQANDIGRTSALIAGYPIHVPGVTLDRQCGSSQQAVHFGAQAIASGDMDVVVAAGVENMSRVPMFSSLQGAKPSKKLTEKYEIIHQGLSAERIAKKWGLTRGEMDEFSLDSHRKAIRAQEEDRFSREILPIQVTDGDGNHHMIEKDSVPRHNTSMKKLSTLKPSFRSDGLVHPGNSSAISDGAAAILLMSGEKVKEFGLNPRFRIVSRVVVGSDPTLMLTGPVLATEKVLDKARLTLNDIDIIEVNEAFAAVPLMWLKETGADPSKLNPNGGAIALGHPLGASGTRLMTTLMYELERTKGRFGLQTMCEGLGMANATIIERLEQ